MRDRADREPISVMNAAQVEDYCAWLKLLAGRRKGSLPDRLRQAASEITNLWSFT